MLKSIYHKIHSFWVRIANIGVSDDLDFTEKKKTQLINIIVATGIPVNIFFFIVNTFQHWYLLSINNLLLLLGGFVILIINSYRKFLLGRLLLTFFASLLFTTGAVFYRNGGEYFLIVNMIVIIIYFNERKYLILISIISALLFLGIKVFIQLGPIYQTVSFGRIVFNICWSLLIIILTLQYFKREQINYMKKIEEQNKELHLLNNTKQKLFSIIAHDLRSPIGQLKNSLDLANKEYISPEDFLKVSARLSSEVDQLHTTLDNLLKWSISQLQGINAVPEKINLKDMFEKKNIFFNQSLDQKNIRLKFTNLTVFIYADPDHLRLVLRNLISNAIKYSYPESVIEVSAVTNNQQVVIQIADSGVGMNQEIRDSIFHTANMVSSVGTDNEKGTGLGLKLCKEFIEKNNGRIWVESTENSGSRFYISLPEAK